MNTYITSLLYPSEILNPKILSTIDSRGRDKESINKYTLVKAVIEVDLLIEVPKDQQDNILPDILDNPSSIDKYIVPETIKIRNLLQLKQSK